MGTGRIRTIGKGKLFRQTEGQYALWITITAHKLSHLHPFSRFEPLNLPPHFSCFFPSVFHRKLATQLEPTLTFSASQQALSFLLTLVQVLLFIHYATATLAFPTLYCFWLFTFLGSTYCLVCSVSFFSQFKLLPVLICYPFKAHSNPSS